MKVRDSLYSDQGAMKLKNLMLAVTVLVVISSVALAAPPKKTTKTSPTKPTKHVAALVCPVTGDKIASAAKAAGHSTFKGKTYYFCCPGCKPRFDKEPAKFVKNSAKGKFEEM